MRRNTKHRSDSYYSVHGNEEDINGLFERLKAYKGKPKSLINSLLFWLDNKPNYSNKPKWVFKGDGKSDPYKDRAKILVKRIRASTNYPSNYIRVKDRSGMLAVVKLFGNY